jgi:Rps23 Pro-64 3,4-dihydroxylase Tpa1-like proline 4-hydroxylase
LDIHVDAGIHPKNKMKKQVTLGIYLSKDINESHNGQLELWSGDNAVNHNSKILKKCVSIAPLFNRLILFECNDYSWHGNPEPALCPHDSVRIFVTLSYSPDSLISDRSLLTISLQLFLQQM